MPPRRGLKLNSLPRSSKAVSQYVLEEHGHCEVPAGCGGVVLRWRNPHRGAAVTLWIYTAGAGAFLLDGSPPASGRPILGWGPHTLCLKIADPDPAHAILMFAGLQDEMLTSDAQEAEANACVLSAPDGSWKYRLSEPPPAWTSPGFDDTGWPAMVAANTPEPAKDDYMNAHRVGKLEQLGALGLGVPERGAAVWIRKTFELRRPPAVPTA